ncbi:MAG: agmatinase [Candidatus Micrarchaeaceae archaeon]
MPPYTLFGVDNDYNNAKIVVLPIPYDSTTTYKAGARDGPHAIIDASRNMEFYSEELRGDVTELGIYTLDELFPNLNSAEETVNMIEKEVGNILDDKKIPLCIGGDHTIAVGAIRAVSKRNKDLSVIHFDAHSDARDTYAGSKYCHACIMARAREVCSSCLSVGVRSIDADSAVKYGKEIIYRKDMHNLTIDQIVNEIVNRTKERVYITIDVDVIDPSEMPSTGTPEPDGLRFGELTAILRGVLAKKKLLGLDFTELSPPAGNNLTAPNFLVAKLIYLTLGYAYYRRG